MIVAVCFATAGTDKNFKAMEDMVAVIELRESAQHGI